jgi:hypothetical protein
MRRRHGFGRHLLVLEVLMTTLALLIGTNPLPNLITARWLHRPPGAELSAVRLYYTKARPSSEAWSDTGTVSIANELKVVLERLVGPGRVTSIDLPGPVDSAQTRDTMLTDLRAHGGPTIHINYTGGTKAMSRGAWLAGEQLAREKRLVTLSYLDERAGLNKAATHHALRLAELDARGMVKRWLDSPADLRRSVQLDPNDLLSIHGLVAVSGQPNPDSIQVDHRRRLASAIDAAAQSVGVTSAVVWPDGLLVRRVAGAAANTMLPDVQLAALVGYQLILGWSVPAPANAKEAEVKRSAFRALYLASTSALMPWRAG